MKKDTSRIEGTGRDCRKPEATTNLKNQEIEKKNMTTTMIKVQ